MGHVAQGECMPFTGYAGHALMMTVAGLTVALCAARYGYARHVGSDIRSVRQYTYDMSKIAISQTAAWVVNVGMTTLIFTALAALEVSSHAAVSSIEGIGWYMAVFLMDFALGVPLGVWLSRVVNRACEAYWRRWLSSFLKGEHAQCTSFDLSEPAPGCFGCCCDGHGKVAGRTGAEVDSDELADWVEQLASEGQLPRNDQLPCVARIAEQNRVYGKYGRQHHGTNSDTYADRWGPALSGVWWTSQLATFSMVIAFSRVVSGLVIIFLLYVDIHPSNPIVGVAQFVTDLPWSCGKKQWVVAGGVRVAVDVLQFLIFDAVNRLRSVELYTELA